MLLHSAVLASLLAGAQAGIAGLVAEGLTRHSPATERRYQELAKANLRARQAAGTPLPDAGPGNNVAFNPDGTIDMTAWDEMTNAACESALSALPAATNPSGTCTCYNLPVINNQTGTFQADLRLYRISAATGAFAGIAPENVQVALSYNGASVSPVTAQMEQQRVSRRSLGPRQAGSSPQHLQTYFFVGQIDQSQMNPMLDMPTLEALVMPVVTLSAVDPTGKPVSTNVSSNEAAFVAGAFSQSDFTSDFNLAMRQVQKEMDSLVNGTTAFVMPGVQVLVFPVGTVITSAWLAVALAAYGFGTYERIRHNDMYRSRLARVTKGGVGRI